MKTESINKIVHRRIAITLKLVLALGVLLLLLQGRYQPALEVTVILLVTMLPLFLGNRFQVHIPYEFESLAVIFLFMALFMGEFQGYYVRYWWWDALLHTGSGLLLGILGFLLVFVMNEKKEVQLELHPKFMALFAFMFAVGIGALWEIFEYAMDQLFGLNMQKSGLQDTMWDLIVDTAGALVISVLGWAYFRNPSGHFFLKDWIDIFIEKNPRLFTKD